MLEGIEVDIWLVDDLSRPYGFRRWKNIPRIGDSIELGRDGGWSLGTVELVRWGQYRDRPDEQRVALFVKWKD